MTGRLDDLTTVRGGLVAIGLALVVFALAIAGYEVTQDRPAEPALIGTFLGAGLLLLLVGALVPWLKSIGGGSTMPTFQFDREAIAQERAAAAEAGDVDVDPDTVASKIDSDDPGPPDPSEDDEEVVGTLNYITGNLALRSILISMQEVEGLKECDLRVYLYDAGEDRLMASFETVTDDSLAWAPGTGATGTAYETGKIVVVEGPAVSDATYGLTPEQQERYKDLTAVAAVPITNAAGTVLGVLTASTRRPDNQLLRNDVLGSLTLGAMLVSRILVELLKYFDDSSTTPGPGAVTPGP